ncbi:MAG: phosphoribosyltransferase family protein [Patescibacteria group bacterium]
MKIFKDRQAAGKLLAKRLKNVSSDLVLGIPRGGVVVAAEVARKLSLPLDVLVVRKIGAPFQSELALGAVDGDGEVVWEEDLLKEVGVSREELGDIIKNEWKELKRREDLYRAGKGELNVDGKVVILVDDGIATGATTLSAINYLKRHKAKVILAIPVASKEAVDKIRAVEGVRDVVLEIPEYFQAVGQFYQDFLPVSDEEVVEILRLPFDFAQGRSG